MLDPSSSASIPPIQPSQLERVLKRSRQSDDLGDKIHMALVMIDRALEDLSEAATAISFNGGKDCTVLLHLYAAVLYARHASSLSAYLRSSFSREPSIPSPSPRTKAASHSTFTPPPLPHSSASASHPTHLPYPPIKTLYISCPSPFPVLEQFIHASVQRYGLELENFEGKMKTALSAYLAGRGQGVTGMLMGTRRGDPNGNVADFAPTDGSWPPLLRIHPILHWSYSDVWTFLRELDVEYCTLYDEGYTSLGSTTNTVPNPLLRNEEQNGGWDPAWKLKDASKERAGRLDASS